MKRTKHSLSHYKLLTCDMGELIPITCYEVLPGDSIQQATSVLLRVSPLLAPVMHPVSVRVHHWFVPNRLTWNKYYEGTGKTWENFITGGSDGLGNGSTPPTYTSPGGAVKGSFADYVGLPIGVPGTVSVLPLLAYNLIHDEHYRDQDLVNPLWGSPSSGTIAKVAWEKDYFTTARPWPQKGPEITLPLGTQAPVRGIATGSQAFPSGPLSGFDNTGAVTYPTGRIVGTTGADAYLYVDGSPGSLPRIYADLTEASAVNVNEVRRAFALQRYQEARAQYGSRYTEYLAYLGVKSSDSRLQRPEYLGGGKATISFSEVLQTGPGTDDDGVADLKGHGISALRTRRFRRYFEEHGFVMSLLSVRPKTMYAQGVEKMWTRQTKEDYWQRELELIGQQEVVKQEIFATGTPTDQEIFGYQDRYAEYRHIRSSVAGDFRDTLDFWHMARKFASQPVLNSSFIQCDPTKRINAVQTEDVLWVMCNHSIQARRMVTKKTIGRII